MCEDCFLEEIFRFESQLDFEEFERTLQKKCDSEKIKIPDDYSTNSLDILSSRLYYKCVNCDQVWYKSIPENAWRGYFLTEQKALEHIDNLKKEDKKKALGCIVVLTIILIITIWLTN